MKRRRVLVQAFACCPPGTPPFEGGEDLLGWMLIRQLAQHYELWVLTHPKRRPGIDAHLAELPEGAVMFCYVRLPGWWEWCLRVAGLHQLYYYAWQVTAWRRARRLHQRLRFSLFHHLTYANDWMGNVIGALERLPYLRGPGGGAQRVPPAFLQEFSRAGQLAQRLRDVGQWVFRHDPLFLASQARAHTLLVCSQEALTAVPERWRSKTQLYPVNGIGADDLAALEPLEPEPGRPFTVLSAGKLLRLKGFTLALKAFHAFHRRCPEARFEIYGDGPDRAALERLIGELGLAGCVTLQPWVARTELLEALRRCDAFLFPSLRDGGGAVVVEAMAAGRPVVCLNLGGPAFHVTEETGINVAADTPAQAVRDLALALERLARDPRLCRRLGLAARRRAVADYQWETLGERMWRIYEQAIGAADAAAEHPRMRREVVYAA